MNVDVLDTQGKVVGSAELDETVWGIEPNIPIMHQALLAAAGQRPPRHPRHQDARRGARWWCEALAAEGNRACSPGFHPLATVDRRRRGLRPAPAIFKQDMPRKMRRLAVRSALSSKVKDERLTVIDGLSDVEPRDQGDEGNPRRFSRRAARS